MMQAVAIFFVSRPESLLIWSAIAAIAGVYWFYKGFRLLQRKRLILNTPASRIRSASMGLVEISGLAAGPYVLTSPFKQTECYYYRSVAWQLKQEGRSSKWVKVAEETLHVPFYLDDNTDKVLVDPRGADMDLHCDFHEQYHRSALFSGQGMPGCVSEFLLRHAANPNKRIKVEEYCIKPKNFLFVLGTLSQNPECDAGLGGTPGFQRAQQWQHRCRSGSRQAFQWGTRLARNRNDAAAKNRGSTHEGWDFQSCDVGSSGRKYPSSHTGADGSCRGTREQTCQFRGLRPPSPGGLDEGQS